MQMEDRTKIMFAETLEEMLRETSLSQIRVTKLCERCGATPPTFYYYFHDKYELVAWIYLKDVVSGTSIPSTDYTPELLDNMNKQIESRKLFYQKAFDDSSQNSIEKYIIDFNLQIADDAYANVSHGRTMSFEQFTELRYHQYGVLGLFREWLFGTGNITSMQMSEFLFTKTPDFMKTAYSRYQYSAKKILGMAGRKSSS